MKRLRPSDDKSVIQENNNDCVYLYLAIWQAVFRSEKDAPESPEASRLIFNFFSLSVVSLPN